MLAAVLQNKVAAGVKYARAHYKVRKCVQAVQGIRRISKDKVELLCAKRNKVKDIVANHCQLIRNAKLLCSVRNKSGIGRRHLYAPSMADAT